VTGRILDERLGQAHFWMSLVGFHLTFFVQHILGLQGMPRRVASYRAEDGFTVLNQVSSIGAFLLAASTLPFLWNVWRTLRGRAGDTSGANPWGGHTLEWATTSPPPSHNFETPLPPIRSNRPVWDADHG
jgi:cytochrome c oxidase subunit 1